MPEDSWTPLTGGNVNIVAQRGEVVRRQLSAASPAVHELLGHLEQREVPLVPRLIGREERYEYLSFLPGQAVSRPWSTAVLSDIWLTELGTWLRTYHGAVRGFRVQEAFLWGPTKPEPEMLVCHGDLGPWNCLQQNGRLSGVIDWDLARYGNPLDDVAELALEAVPLHNRLTETLGETSQRVRVARLEAFCGAYGVAVQEVLGHVPVYLQMVIDDTRELALRGVEPFTAFEQGGIVTALETDLRDYQHGWS